MITKIIPAFLARRRSVSRPAVTCAQLAKEGRFDSALCCKECHADQSLLINYFVTGRNPLKGQRKALLCCHCIELLDDWHPGQIIAQLPEHEE